MMLPAPKNRAKVMKPKLMISWVRRVEFIGNTQKTKMSYSSNVAYDTAN